MTSQEWREIEEVLAVAVELPENVQAGYVADCCAGRPWVRVEVEALLSMRREASAAFNRPPEMPSAESLSQVAIAGQRFGPYRVVRPLGAGGMGQVYLAERDDDQFHRQVAIKMAAVWMASPEVLARFDSERRILATLDHPNIARLLDAGISQNRRPFFVMEFVDGVPLAEFCDRRKLSMRDRLQLFRAICSAVHFAHQHLIVHRDIKPGNILVTADGVPKLLDFGIAKMLAPSHGGLTTVTALNHHPMTPEYASPEQLRGGAITTASDVYSLGAVLYELLTAIRPFHLDGLTLEGAARLITTTEPLRPSRAEGARRRDLEGDLDAIVLKALRSDPRERYASAEDLSADIGRCLDGMPVLARRGNFHYVARKFIVRHRTAVAAAAVGAILLIAAGIALAYSARVAQAERARAQERFEQVRQLANSLLFELHDSIAAVPGSTGVRKQLVARALQYLEALEQTSSGDSGLQLNLAQSYERLGSVQGHISEVNLGDPQGALASYGRAIAILDRIPPAAPGHTDILKQLGHLHVLRGDVYRDLRQSSDRDREYQQALAIMEQLAQRFPNDDDIVILYSSALFGIGKGYAAADPEAARRLFLRSLRIDERLYRAHPDEWKYQRNLALDYKYLSSVVPSHQEALDHLRKAQALDEKRLAGRPDNPQTRLDLSFDLSEIAGHLKETGDLVEALRLCRRVQSIREELADADPNDAQLRLRVVTAGKGTAEVLEKMGRPEAALVEYRAAAARAEAAVAATPVDPRNRSALAEIEVGIGTNEDRIAARSGAANASEHRRRSCEAYVRASQVVQSLMKDGIATTVERELAKKAVEAAAACGPQSRSGVDQVSFPGRSSSSPRAAK
jgi:non-specific serine/threonine protein kinase/serine/threonine-protein kinase